MILTVRGHFLRPFNWFNAKMQACVGQLVPKGPVAQPLAPAVTTRTAHRAGRSRICLKAIRVRSSGSNAIQSSFSHIKLIFHSQLEISRPPRCSSNRPSLIRAFKNLDRRCIAQQIRPSARGRRFLGRHAPRFHFQALTKIHEQVFAVTEVGEPNQLASTYWQARQLGQDRPSTKILVPGGSFSSRRLASL
jgi:hypothetical protein